MYAGSPYAGFPYANGGPFSGSGGGPVAPSVTNRAGGRRRGGYALVLIDVAVSVPETFPGSGVPATLPGPGVDKAVPYPAPTVTDGWPT